MTTNTKLKMKTIIGIIFVLPLAVIGLYVLYALFMAIKDSCQSIWPPTIAFGSITAFWIGMSLLEDEE